VTFYNYWCRQFIARRFVVQHLGQIYSAALTWRTKAFKLSKVGGQANGLTNLAGVQANGLTNLVGSQSNDLTNLVGSQSNDLTNLDGSQSNGLINLVGSRARGLRDRTGGRERNRGHDTAEKGRQVRSVTEGSFFKWRLGANLSTMYAWAWTVLVPNHH
jgi:hypothetical protein